MARRAQSGQALVVVAAFAACLVGAFLLVFNVGQVVNDKIRLHNAADAAAYSAALWEARSLNFQAYTNRAIVANEVAIAQFVSLRSWSEYVGQTIKNASVVSSWVPPAAQVMTLLARSWQGVNTTLQTSLPVLEGGISRWNVDVLATAQAIAHQQALVASADLVGEVARETEPRAQVAASTRLFQAQNASGWQNQLTARYRRGGGELTRFRDLLMSARDGFSASRRADLLPSNPFVAVTKRGGTDLVGEYVWRGMDTLAVHVDYVLGSTEIPVGWGAAENRLQPVRTRGEHGGSWRDNPRSSRLADRALQPRNTYAGLPEIRDIVRPAQQQDLRLAYTVELALPQDQLLTADRVATSTGVMLPDGSLLDVAPSLAHDALYALSSAEVFFRRPVERADHRQEYPSLFNPYWQARLVPVSATARAVAAPLKGLAADPYAVLP